jgi:molybdopterin converting factor subunit 1
MKVRVRLFALARDVAGQEAVDVEVSADARVLELRSALAERYPALAGVLRVSLVAVNAEYAGEAVVLRETDEVALIPPVSGG